MAIQCNLKSFTLPNYNNPALTSLDVGCTYNCFTRRTGIQHEMENYKIIEKKIDGSDIKCTEISSRESLTEAFDVSISTALNLHQIVDVKFARWIKSEKFNQADSQWFIYSHIFKKRQKTLVGDLKVPNTSKDTHYVKSVICGGFLFFAFSHDSVTTEAEARDFISHELSVTGSTVGNSTTVGLRNTRSKSSVSDEFHFEVVSSAPLSTNIDGASIMEEFEEYRSSDNSRWSPTLFEFQPLLNAELSTHFHLNSSDVLRISTEINDTLAALKRCEKRSMLSITMKNKIQQRLKEARHLSSQFAEVIEHFHIDDNFTTFDPRKAMEEYEQEPLKKDIEVLIGMDSKWILKRTIPNDLNKYRKAKAAESELKVMLLGRVGHGKSSLANYLTESDYFPVSDKSEACTADVRSTNIKVGSQSLVVYDTPGFFDYTNRHKLAYTNIIQECRNTGIHAFLWVIRADCHGDAKETLEILKYYISKKLEEYTIIVFTRCEKREVAKLMQNEFKDITPQFKQRALGVRTDPQISDEVSPEEVKQTQQILVNVVNSIISENGAFQVPRGWWCSIQ